MGGWLKKSAFFFYCRNMLIFDQKSNPIVKICAEWLTSRADCFTIVHGLFCDFIPHGLRMIQMEEQAR